MLEWVYDIISVLPQQRYGAEIFGNLMASERAPKSRKHSQKFATGCVFERFTLFPEVDEAPEIARRRG